VDNTNPDRVARKRYVDVAAALKVRVRCFHMTTSRPLAEHLNHVRVALTRGATAAIPDIAYNTYNKRFELPDLNEGYADVCQINFLPDFRNEEERKHFLQWSDD